MGLVTNRVTRNLLFTADYIYRVLNSQATAALQLMFWLCLLGIDTVALSASVELHGPFLKNRSRRKPQSSLTNRIGGRARWEFQTVKNFDSLADFFLLSVFI